MDLPRLELRGRHVLVFFDHRGGDAFILLQLARKVEGELALAAHKTGDHHPLVAVSLINFVMGDRRHAGPVQRPSVAATASLSGTAAAA